jgi:hypothetical protein
MDLMVTDILRTDCDYSMKSSDTRGRTGEAMNFTKPTAIEPAAEPRKRRSILFHVLANCLALLSAAGLFAAYEHFKLHDRSTASWVCLAAAALLALLPLRALLREVFAVEGRVLHLLHGIGGLALIALPLSGLVSGGRVLNHAALAPFAIMGAAQAIMHQNHPRNAQQAEALRRVSTRVGLGLGLDSIEHTIDLMGASPAAAGAAPALRKRLMAVRKAVQRET